MPDTARERRNFVRFSRIFGLKFKDSNANEGKAQTHDISAKGIGFITETALDAGTSLELWLFIPDNNEPVYGKGKVVWSTMVTPSLYRVGVELEKVDFVAISRILPIRT